MKTFQPVNESAASLPSEEFFCTKPFESVEVHLTGNAYVCCPSWLKKPIGNIHETPISEIWNSQVAQDIRASILDGSYKYCDKKECPFLHTKVPATSNLNPQEIEALRQSKPTILDYQPLDIMLTYDPSCNLSCPSCRTKKISFTQDSPEYSKSKSITDNIYQDYIENLGDKFLRLNVTGSGDPFASLVFRQFLEGLDGSLYPNLKIDLQTNGLLLTPSMWERMKKIHKNIDNVFVSIDAATEKTYSIVRRGGHWDTILKNMKFLGELRKRGEIRFLMARFVVQKANYVEMPAFAKMFRELGSDSIYFSRMNNWETWEEREFNQNVVADSKHPEFEKFVKVLTHKELQHNKVNLGNLLTLQRDALNYQIANSPQYLKHIKSLKYKIKFAWNDLVRRRFYIPGPIQRVAKKCIAAWHRRSNTLHK